jgi:hypothetical protein
MGIMWSMSKFVPSLNVFKTRKVCRIIRESVSFFPPLFCALVVSVSGGPGSSSVRLRGGS